VKFALGVDIGGTMIKLAVVDENINIVHKISCESIVGDAAATVARVSGHIREIEKTFTVSSVGVCCPGTITEADEVYADNLAWHGVPVKRLLEEGLQRQIGFSNDGAASLLAESRHGALKNLETGCYLTFGTGVGGGFLTNGKPYKGNKNVSPEPGHMITHAGGRACTCGAHGCFERYASADALASAAPGYSAKDIADMARAGDDKMLGIWREYVRDMSIGIISLMSVFNPRRIALGGGISEAGGFLLESLYTELNKNAAYRNYYSDIEVQLGAFRSSAGVIGAALLAL